MNPQDILKRTPKSNCGECGYPACLAFAAHVARSGEDPAKCPHIDLSGLEIGEKTKTSLENAAEEHDLQLVRYLREKIRDLDFGRIAPPLGVRSGSDDTVLYFSYLGQEVVLDKNGILLDGREPEDPRDQILLYNYISSGGGHPPAGEWIGLESLPNSISKVKTLAVYCEERLAELFTGWPAGDIHALSEPLGAAMAPGSSADAALIIPVLPRLPQQLLFWDEEPDDGFPAKVKILFDRDVLSYLDLESLVFSSERLADRFLLMANRNR